ncbi:Zinc knuckle CX2CX4HX4C [Corchorus olitorius]|uniref:Zinc knuckle CX2CX4HX4C n=1 Tax=Corchorus olitorius TaxID=93759 RepID=A0A1R3KFX5_9ROSI|nr:Zinc knuckle CX2CX4HX4C [Corchorus olitorius]
MDSRRCVASQKDSKSQLRLADFDAGDPRGVTRGVGVMNPDMDMEIKLDDFDESGLALTKFKVVGGKQGWVRRVEDPITNGGIGRSFLRIRVGIDVERPLVNGLWVLRKNRDRSWVEVRYEKLGEFYFTCGRLGHVGKHCSEEGVEISGKGYGPVCELCLPNWGCVGNTSQREGWIVSCGEEITRKIIKKGQRVETGGKMLELIRVNVTHKVLIEAHNPNEPVVEEIADDEHGQPELDIPKVGRKLWDLVKRKGELKYKWEQSCEVEGVDSSLNAEGVGDWPKTVTKNKKEKLEKIRRKMHINEAVSVEPVGLSGGLALWWKEEMKINVIQESKTLLILLLKIFVVRNVG